MPNLPEGRGALVPNRQILYNKQCFPWGVMPLKRERPMAEVKKKVYLETSFVSYLTGRRTQIPCHHHAQTLHGGCRP